VKERPRSLGDTSTQKAHASCWFWTWKKWVMRRAERARGFRPQPLELRTMRCDHKPTLAVRPPIETGGGIADDNESGRVIAIQGRRSEFGDHSGLARSRRSRPSARRRHETFSSGRPEDSQDALSNRASAGNPVEGRPPVLAGRERLMDELHPPCDETWPGQAARRVDAACDRFEDAWRLGAPPRIEDYLAAADTADQPALLHELLELELELRKTTRRDSRRTAGWSTPSSATSASQRRPQVPIPKRSPAIRLINPHPRLPSGARNAATRSSE
jgi:hypothetical protein